MQANAHLAKAQLNKQLLCLLKHLELGGSDRLAVGDARGQAGKGGLVPARQAHMPGERPNVGLAEARASQGAGNPELADSLHAGAVVCQVIEVGALHHHRDSLCRRLLLDHAQKLELAEVAPVGRIGRKGLELKAVEVYDEVAHPEGAAKGLGFVEFALGEEAGAHRDGQELICQCLACGIEQQRRVHPAGKGERRAPVALEQAQQLPIACQLLR